MFFEPHEADCHALSKQKTDEIEKCISVMFSTYYVDIRQERFELYTTDYNTTKAHIREQMLV